MTLPRNFPGRANARRIGALKRLGTELTQAHANISNKIVDQNYALSQKTKKDHSHKAKLRGAR